VQEAAARLRGSGIAVWLVGGALRDLRLGRPVRDVDLLVDAPLERAGLALPGSRQVGAHRPILLLGEGQHRIEISAFRAGARSVEEDLRRRDFTVNALAYRIDGEEWIDPLGGGRDLDARRLRATDPARSFVDDAVRVLRGARLERELELVPEPATLRAMERESWRLAHAAPERVRDAFVRVLALHDARSALERLRALGALAAFLPEALRGVGIEQNHHHAEDVHRHTLRVLELLPPDPELRLAALLHDCAKVETKLYAPARGDFRFLRHERAALLHVRRAEKRLRLSLAQGDRLRRLVLHHLLYPERLRGDAAIRRMLGRVGRDILEPLLELRRADYASRHGGLAPREWSEAEARIRAVAAREPPARLAIGGADVMRELGLAPGPEVGRWLRRADARIRRHPERSSRASLLAWLRAQREGV
jgi:tRNA nucleotidyltransferase/poly(A) polymerase